MLPDLHTAYSNGVAISVDERHFAPLPDSTDLLGDPRALRRRFQEAGVVRLRGVLSPSTVIGLRRSYLSTLPPGMIMPGTPLEEGVFSGHIPDRLPAHGVAGHPAHTFVRSAEFTSFIGDPALTRLAETLLGGAARLLPRRILRHFYAGSDRASRAHTDYAYMDQGTENAVTMWIPIGDCPFECGGLVYLENSHTVTQERLDTVRERSDRPGDSRPLSHDLGWTARTLGLRWLWADYRAGDVVVHSPHVVHASLDSWSKRMRVSADVRFVRDGEAVDSRWTKQWSGDDGA
ncbi:MAG: phytanoyl-CoA dioxygenase family protein [Nocardiopsaceae bacterium]|nr:phytanoyl-CoA dioxygenase family protein [Nocardiopsaceae bacterium]